MGTERQCHVFWGQVFIGVFKTYTFYRIGALARLFILDVAFSGCLDPGGALFVTTVGPETDINVTGWGVQPVGEPDGGQILGGIPQKVDGVGDEYQSLGSWLLPPGRVGATTSC